MGSVAISYKIFYRFLGIAEAKLRRKRTAQRKEELKRERLRAEFALAQESLTREYIQFLFQIFDRDDSGTIDGSSVSRGERRSTGLGWKGS